MDQVKPISIDTAVDAVTSELCGLDILVNNAAWNKAVPFADLDALTPELCGAACTTPMCRGPYLVTRACAPHLKKSGNGLVVNISAFIGLSCRTSIAHATAKAALMGKTAVLPWP